MPAQPGHHNNTPCPPRNHRLSVVDPAAHRIDPAFSTVEPALSAAATPTGSCRRSPARPVGQAGGARAGRQAGVPAVLRVPPQGGRLGVPACPTAAGRAHKHHGTRTSPGPSPLAALRRPPGEAAPRDLPAKPRRGTSRRSRAAGPPGEAAPRDHPAKPHRGTTRRSRTAGPPGEAAPCDLPAYYLLLGRANIRLAPGANAGGHVEKLVKRADRDAPGTPRLSLRHRSGPALPASRRSTTPGGLARASGGTLGAPQRFDNAQACDWTMSVPAVHVAGPRRAQPAVGRTLTVNVWGLASGCSLVTSR